MKNLKEFKAQVLNGTETNNIKGGASNAAKAAAMHFCEWYVGLSSTARKYLAGWNALAEKIATS